VAFKRDWAIAAVNGCVSSHAYLSRRKQIAGYAPVGRDELAVTDNDHELVHLLSSEDL
jgi:hypothetical protein